MPLVLLGMWMEGEPQESLITMLPEGSKWHFRPWFTRNWQKTRSVHVQFQWGNPLWIDAVEGLCFCETYSDVEYVNVGSKALVGLFAVVFVKKELSIYWTGFHCFSLVWIMGIVGTREQSGSDSRFTTITSVLWIAIWQRIRIKFWGEIKTSKIYKRLCIPCKSEKSSKRHEAFTDAYWDAKALSVWNSAIFGLVGDFNYRVDMDGQLARIFVQHGQIDSVLENDQMKREKEQKAQIFDSVQWRLSHFSIVQFDPGSDNYDSSEKQRVPSWCDEFWRNSEKINANSYDCLFEFKSSDHKPVRLVSNLCVNELVLIFTNNIIPRASNNWMYSKMLPFQIREVSRHSIDAGLIAYHHVVRRPSKSSIKAESWRSTASFSTRSVWRPVGLESSPFKASLHQDKLRTLIFRSFMTI